MHTTEVLNTLMSERNISAYDLSERTGLSDERILKITNGESKMTVDELRAICVALDVSADVFVNKTKR